MCTLYGCYSVGWSEMERSIVVGCIFSVHTHCTNQFNNDHVLNVINNSENGISDNQK